MQQRLEEMDQKKGQFRYSRLGVLFCLLGIPFHRKNHYFCSQFVAEILKDAKAAELVKDSTLYYPGDFRRMPGMRLHFQGNLRGMMGHLALV